MSQAILERLKGERAEVESYVTRTLESVEGGRDLTEAELRTVNDSRQRIVEIDAQIAPLAEFMQSRSAGVDLSGILGRGESRHDGQQSRSAAPSLSDFIDSDQFRAWGGRGKSDRFDVEGFQARAGATHILETGAAPGSAMLPSNQKVFLSAPDRPRPLLAACNYIPVNTNAVDMVFYGSPDGAKTFAKVDEKAAKPEVQIDATSAPVVLPTIAGWVAATRQLLEDAPAARAVIEGQLRRGYYTALEKEAVTSIGAATFQKVTGAAGDSMLVVARQAQAQLQGIGYDATALVTSPADAAAMDIALLGVSLVGAIAGQKPWGLNVIPVAGLTKSYVGDVESAVTWLERSGVQVFITDSHEDFFVKNTFVILAEGRSAFPVTNTAAMVEVATTPKAP